MIGIACMLGFGIASAYAQTAAPCGAPANCQRENCAQVNCQQTNCPQTNCPQVNCAQVPCDRQYKGRPGQCYNFSCFNGLNLTDSQKQQLQALCKNYGDKRQALRQDSRQNKQRNDSLKKDMRNKAQDLKRQQLADIKKILTPEQYTQFLEQNYVNQGQKHAARGNFKHHKFSKHGQARAFADKSPKAYMKDSYKDSKKDYKDSKKSGNKDSKRDRR